MLTNICSRMREREREKFRAEGAGHQEGTRVGALRIKGVKVRVKVRVRARVGGVGVGKVKRVVREVAAESRRNLCTFMDTPVAVIGEGREGVGEKMGGTSMDTTCEAGGEEALEGDEGSEARSRRFEEEEDRKR